VLEETNQTEEIVERVAALDIGKAELVCCVRVPGKAGKRTGGGHRLRHDDPLAAGAGRPAGRAGGDQGGHGGHQRLLEGPVLPAGGPGVGGLAGQRAGGQAPPGAAQDRQAGCGVACQAGRAGHAAAQLRAAPADPAAAGPGPATVPTWSRCAPPRSSGSRSCSRDAQIKLSVVASDSFGVSGRAMLPRAHPRRA
jgi:hypothetical protein